MAENSNPVPLTPLHPFEPLALPEPYNDPAHLAQLLECSYPTALKYINGGDVRLSDAMRLADRLQREIRDLWKRRIG